MIEFLSVWKWVILGGFCCGLAVQIWRKDPTMAGFLLALAVFFAFIGAT